MKIKSHFSSSSTLSDEISDLIADRLARFGHRNWIVIADSAYPAQSRHGIETVVTDCDHLTVVQSVLDAVDKASHVRADILLDSELAILSDIDAPGADEFRRNLASVCSGQSISSVLHEELISKLDKAAELFEILILKTTFAIPYTSVFVRLECGYWNTEAEKRLRDIIAKQSKSKGKSK